MEDRRKKHTRIGPSVPDPRRFSVKFKLQRRPNRQVNASGAQRTWQGDQLGTDRGRPPGDVARHIAHPGNDAETTSEHRNRPLSPRRNRNPSHSRADSRADARTHPPSLAGHRCDPAPTRPHAGPTPRRPRRRPRRREPAVRSDATPTRRRAETTPTPSQTPTPAHPTPTPARPRPET